MEKMMRYVVYDKDTKEFMCEKDFTSEANARLFAVYNDVIIKPKEYLL